MSTNTIPDPTDYATVLAALSQLSIDVHVSKHSGIVEVFTLAPNEDEPTGGFKFTFKDEKLIGLHARNLREGCDHSWNVISDDFQ